MHRSDLGRDPRHFQIAALGGLLGWGLVGLDLEVRPLVAVVVLATAEGTQWLGSRLTRIGFDPRSPLISALSLTLLLRTDSLALAAAVAAVTIGSKFLVRIRGKHVFNPTNLGLVLGILASDRIWVSPGQWGSAALLAFLAASAGFVVVRRAERSDVTWAFLAAWSTIVLGRSVRLGDPWAIPLHQLENGALLIFAFYMISDPKTTPDRRSARILFAVLVAAVAAVLRFSYFEPNALLFALAGCAPLVPLLDRLLPARQYRWPADRPLPSAPIDPAVPTEEPDMSPAPTARRPAPSFSRSLGALGLVLGLAATSAPPAAAFCGFYVARADTDLFNEASKVVMVRDGDRTVLTMANDYRGEPSEFALVVPVPTVLQREQIHVGDPAILDHLDAYTAPRLVEYHDPDPCQRVLYESARAVPAPTAALGSAADQRRAAALGVRIEAQYSVGEYDILILSAERSRGLETWLVENGYRIPDGAAEVLGSYIRQNLRFFVAKVDLEEQERLGYSFLRPLQVAYESPRFMLPIRLGTVNARGPQELFVFALTRTGRVETTNYRTVKLPSGVEIPPYVEDEFADFYRDLFAEQVEKEDMRAVFLEYAWDMGWCDPCAADPLSERELRELGVFWIGDGGDAGEAGAGRIAPPRPPGPPGPGPRNVFVTRLHVRYTAAKFPEDLFFQETGDRTNFQGRFVLRHPWRGEANCPEADRYRRATRERQEQEARTLASLTGWPIEEIRERIDWLGDEGPAEVDEPWWKRIWD